MEQTNQTQKEISRPIRIILSISNDYGSGFVVVYEKENGSADRLNVWFNSDDFLKVRFADNEPSHVVWTATSYQKQVSRGGIFGELPKFETRESWEVKEIVIRCRNI